MIRARLAPRSHSKDGLRPPKSTYHTGIAETDSLTSHLPALAAPAENQRRSLPRRPQPEPLLLPIGEGRWLHEATTLRTATSADPAPIEAGVRLTPDRVFAARGSIVIGLVVTPGNVTEATLETEAGPVRITLDTTGGSRWETGSDSHALDTSHVELRLSPTSTTVLSNRRVVSSFPAAAVSAAKIETAGCPQAVHIDGATQDAVGLDQLVDEVVTRLDRIDGWRTFGSWRRPVEVFAAPNPTSPPVHPGPRVELLGWLSEGWEGRRASGQWTFHHRDGGTVPPVSLDQYGRVGGLVVFAREPDATPPPDERAADAPSGEALLTGDRAQWMAVVRHCDALLYQLAATAYREHTAGETQLTRDVADLIRALRSVWHPLFAHHVDVVDVMARGLGRYRYSDPEHEARASTVLTALSGRLGDVGIASGPVVVS